MGGGWWVAVFHHPSLGSQQLLSGPCRAATFKPLVILWLRTGSF
jgi:hypothetical protein